MKSDVGQWFAQLASEVTALVGAFVHGCGGYLNQLAQDIKAITVAGRKIARIIAALEDVRILLSVDLLPLPLGCVFCRSGRGIPPD